MEFGINEWIENTSETNRNQHKNSPRNKLSHELSKSVSWRREWRGKKNRPTMKRRSLGKKWKIKPNSVGTFFHTFALCKIDRCRKMYGTLKNSNHFFIAIGLYRLRDKETTCHAIAYFFLQRVRRIWSSLLHGVNKRKKTATTDERCDGYLGREFSFFLILDRFRINRQSSVFTFRCNVRLERESKKASHCAQKNENRFLLNLINGLSRRRV